MKNIEKALKKYLPSEKEEPKTLHKAMRYSVLSSGKRLRPAILIESARACGARLKDAIAAACAIEFVHTYSLIHDDLPSMDDDDTRRGKPTCHKVFGEAAAILAGDALLTLAFNIMASELKAKAASIAIKELSEAIGTKGMAGGQALDLKFSGTRNIELIKKINYLKTAKLFGAAAKLGAIIAGAPKNKARAMERYGLNLGLAFQIIDDITDNEGYALLAGKKISAADAGALIKRAKASIRIFGAKTERLNGIADSLLRKIQA